MKILVIAGYYPPEQSADTRLNQDLVESLSEKGEDVTLIVPFPSRGISVDEQRAYLCKKHEIVNEHLEIYRVGAATKYRQDILRRGLSFLKKSIQMYKVAKRQEVDIVIVVSTPPTLGYIAAMLSYRNKVVYKLQDAFPDSLMHTKKMSEKNIIIRFLRVFERWVYRKVTKICTISDDLKETLISSGVSKEKIEVIYDWIDERKCFPIERKNNFLFDKFGLDRNKIYIAYGGNIGLLQNLKTIVLTSKRFIKTNPELEFVIIGDGSWKTELIEMLKTGEYSNVHWFPMQPTENIAYVYSLGDIGLVSIKPEISKIALPSKTWDILSTGRPVLCEIDLYSGLCDIIHDNKLGYCVEPGNVDDMEKTIKRMLSDMKETQNMGVRGREYILNNLTREATIHKYISMLKHEIGEQLND